MIQVENMSVFFDSKEILKNIKTSFECGKVYAIFGLNGAGKTTFFNSLFGICEFQGNVLFDGNILLKKDISFLETETFFYSFLTGREYISIFQESSTPQIFDIEQLSKLFNIPLDIYIEKYSTGMKKKIALLGIIKLNRSIYILDEPFNGLDVESTFILKSVIRLLRDNGKTIFISSHIMESLTGVCDCYNILENGQLINLEDENAFVNHCALIYDRINRQVSKSVFQQKI